MNFAAAVKGRVSTSAKLHTVKSCWETEFCKKMTDADRTNLHKFFSLNETYDNVQKVYYFYQLTPKSLTLILVWFRSLEVSDLLITGTQLEMYILTKPYS